MSRSDVVETSWLDMPTQSRGHGTLWLAIEVCRTRDACVEIISRSPRVSRFRKKVSARRIAIFVAPFCSLNVLSIVHPSRIHPAPREDSHHGTHGKSISRPLWLANEAL